MLQLFKFYAELKINPFKPIVVCLNVKANFIINKIDFTADQHKDSRAADRLEYSSILNNLARDVIAT